MIRTFHLFREQDPGGVSGTGKVAEGCVLSNGCVMLLWLTKVASLSLFSSMENLERIHGHKGFTKVVFDDEQN